MPQAAVKQLKKPAGGGVTAEFRSENLDIALIRADNRAQPRESLSTDTTQAYADAMADGAVFPPAVVFFDGNDYWLADGFHRRYAAMSIGLAELRCEVRHGGLRDAILFSCQVNATHGVPRSNEDRRRAVLKLLQDDEWSQWSDREIGRHALVDGKTVARIRAELNPAATVPEVRAFKTKHGTVAKMNTAAIGGGAAPTAVKTAPPATRSPVTRTAVTDNDRPLAAPRRGKEAICDRVREAIVILSGLPPAHEVAEYFAGTDAAIIISERIVPAAAWLAEFSDAWKEDQC